MAPSTTVGLRWLLFGGTHVGLATRTIRARLVARLGANRFHRVLRARARLHFGTALVGIVVMPFSGFWAVLAASLVMRRVGPPRPCNVVERPL